MSDLPLTKHDQAALDALVAAGGDGLSKAEIAAALQRDHFDPHVSNFVKRVRDRGYDLRIHKAGQNGSVTVYRYALGALAEPTADPVPERPDSIRSVQRLVAPDPAFVSSLGAVVSLAYVSMIDGPRARDGEQAS